MARVISLEAGKRVLLAGTLKPAGGATVPCRIIAVGRRAARVVVTTPVRQGDLVHLESARGARVGGLVVDRRGGLLDIALIDVGAGARIGGLR